MLNILLTLNFKLFTKQEGDNYDRSGSFKK